MFLLYIYIFYFFALSLSASSQCPSSWTSYKTVVATIANITHGNKKYLISATRNMNILCIHGRIKLSNLYHFNVSEVSSSFSKSSCTPSLNIEKNSWSNYGLTPNHKRVFMTLEKVSGWNCDKNKDISVDVKNCDKIFWTNWFQSANCSNSAQEVFKKKCLDCDGDVLAYQDQCPGKPIRTRQCPPSWSTWVVGECISANCSSTGRRHRIRKCLYADGSKETNYKLCSGSLTNKTEKCVFNVNNCKNISKNYYIYPSVAVGVALILLLLLVLCLGKNFRKNRLKSLEENVADDVNELESNRNQNEICNVYATVKNENIKQTKNESASKDKVIYTSCIQNDATSTANDAVYQLAVDVEPYEMLKVESNTYNNLKIKNNKDENDYDKLRIDCMSACEKSGRNEYDQIKTHFVKQHNFSNDSLYNVLHN